MAYVISDDTTLSELINLAGKYTDRAYPLGGVFQRESVKNVELGLKEKSYNELIRFLIASQVVVLWVYQDHFQVTPC